MFPLQDSPTKSAELYKLIKLKLRQTILSKSAIININANHSKEYMNAYLFVRQLSAQYKHPIILNYQAKSEAIRYCLSQSNKEFTKNIKVALKNGLMRIQGDNMHLLSNNADRQFKTAKKYDYHKTSNPKLFMQMVFMSHHHNKQKAIIRKKENQTYLGLTNSGSTHTGYNSNNANHSITASCAAISKLFKLNSTSAAQKLLNGFDKRGLIILKKDIQQISKTEFNYSLSQGHKNIRYNKTTKQWHKINASTFELNYNFRIERQSTPFDKLPKEAQITYLNMGWTVEQINKHLA